METSHSPPQAQPATVLTRHLGPFTADPARLGGHVLAHGDLCPMESHQDVKWAQLAGRGVRALGGGSEIWSEEKRGLREDGVD